MTAHDLSVTDVAQRLNVSTATVRRWIKHQHLTAYKLPFDPSSTASQRRAEWRIPETEIERIKAGHVRQHYDRDRYRRAARAA